MLPLPPSGAGVLTLSNSIAWLGWVGGVSAILLFASITLYTSQLLADCYFVNGKRNRTCELGGRQAGRVAAAAAAAAWGACNANSVSLFPLTFADTEAVQSVFGRRGGILIAWIQYTNLWLTAIAYNIAGGTSIQEIGCMLKNADAPCGELKLWQVSEAAHTPVVLGRAALRCDTPRHAQVVTGV